MTEAKRPLKVFLCHAHSDKDAVKALYTRLTQDGVDAWLDKEKLLPGQDWELEIRKAVREADVVVVCLSKQFNQAGFRQKEVRLALDTAMEKPEGEIFIIPARLEECDNLESLRKWHWVDLFEDDGYERLMRALQARADRIGATLQVNKSWLPNVTTPYRSRPSFEKKPKQSPESPKKDDPKLEKIRPKKKIAPRKPNISIIVAVIGLVGMIVVALISSPFIEEMFSSTPELTTVFFTMTVMKAPTKTLIPTTKTPKLPTFARTSVSEEMFSSTPELTMVFSTLTVTKAPNKTLIPSTKTPKLPTFAPTPVIGSFIESDGVTMMYVPAGTFPMGSDQSDDEKPIHSVTLDAYYMDKYEVTNAAYKRCVDAGKCLPPKQSYSYTHIAYYGNSEFDNYPVINVDWNQAKAYCEWREGSLPTEAQWEKAARGTDGRIYPWGNQFNGSRVNFCDKNCSFSWLAKSSDDDYYADTAPVGSYENGKSPYGIYDLAGNVWEWVNDWYDSNYYANSPSSDPLGPTTGQYRVLRGGSWNVSDVNVRSAYRNYHTSHYFNYFVGFRCTKDANP